MAYIAIFHMTFSPVGAVPPEASITLLQLYKNAWRGFYKPFSSHDIINFPRDGFNEESENISVP